MYKVIKEFTDIQDNNHFYKVGESFPRKGYDATDSRLMELSGYSNRQGTPLIRKEGGLFNKDEVYETSRKK